MCGCVDALIILLLALVVAHCARGHARGHAGGHAGGHAREHFYVSQLTSQLAKTPGVPVATPDDRAVNSSELLRAGTRRDGSAWTRADAASDYAVPEYPPATMNASCSVEGCPAVPYRNPLSQYSSSYGTGDVGGDTGPVGCNDLGLPARWNMLVREDDYPFDGDYFSDQWKSARLAVKGPVYNYSEPDALGLTC